jgi:hypothetical protein
MEKKVSISTDQKPGLKQLIVMVFSLILAIASLFIPLPEQNLTSTPDATPAVSSQTLRQALFGPGTQTNPME